jgi:hypothetical protein
LDANPHPKTVGEKPLPAKVTYLKGNDRRQWRAVTQFQRVRAKEVYPGIDLVHYGTQNGELEYDFVVRPGAEPGAIRLAVSGAKQARIDPATGDLVLQVEEGEIRQRKPVLYQERGGQREAVQGAFVLASARNEVTFAVGPYDPARPLVIDPTLLYSTYLGTTGDDRIHSVATEGNGIVYVTGFTDSAAFPVEDQNWADLPSWDAFLTKLDTTQTGAASLLYSSYLGGNSFDIGWGVAAQGSGVVYVTGYTYSNDFLVQDGYQGYQSGADAFLMKLDTSEAGPASVDYSTCLGGSADDIGYGVAVEGNGVVYVSGHTDSTDYPVLGEYQANQPGKDAFVTKLDTTESGTGSLTYSTYLGGSETEECYSVASEANGMVYVAGHTQSTDFPTLGQYQGNQANQDVFLARLDTTQTGALSLLFSTYLGGNSVEYCYSVAAEGNGIVYLTGHTSIEFPTLGGYQGVQGTNDAYLAKLDTTQAGAACLLYSTILGGVENDQGRSVAAGGSGIVYVTGFTNSVAFPTAYPYQGAQGGFDGFVTKLDTMQTGTDSLVFSTYLGGGAEDNAIDLAANGETVYVGGYSFSSDFPTLGEFQGDPGGAPYDGFLAVLDTELTPYNLTAQMVSTTQIQLSWTDISSVETGFKIEMKQTAAGSFSQVATVNAGAGEGTILTYTRSGLAANTSYDFRVRAYYGETDAHYSNSATATTALVGAPTGLTALAFNSSRVDLNWVDNIVGETGFEIWASMNGGAFSLISTGPANRPTFRHIGLSGSHSVTYKVRAYTASNQTLYSNAATAVVMAQPLGLNSQALDSSKILVKWNDNATNELTYEIWRSAGGGAFTLLHTSPANTPRYTDSTVSANQTYSYKVRCKSGAHVSSFTNEDTSPAMLAPTGLDGNAVSSTRVELTWTDNSGGLETSFLVYRKLGTGSLKLIGTTGANLTSYSDLTAQAGRSYTYQVRAASGNDWSSYSNILSVTTP